MGCWLYISFLVVQNKRLSPVGWDTSALLDLAASIRLRFPSTPCPVLHTSRHACLVGCGLALPGIPRQYACPSIGVEDEREPGRMPSGRMRHRRCLQKSAVVSPNWRRCMQAKIPMFSRCVTFGDGEMDFHDRRRHTYLWQPCCFFSWNQILKTRSARRLFCAVSWSSNLTRCRS